MSETIAFFREFDTEPFGMNEANAASHLDFIEHLNLAFDLLVDEKLGVAEAYGCVRETQRMNLRTVIIIGKHGRVIYRKEGSPPVEELLEVLSLAEDE